MTRIVEIDFNARTSDDLVLLTTAGAQLAAPFTVGERLVGRQDEIEVEGTVAELDGSPVLMVDWATLRTVSG